MRDVLLNDLSGFQFEVICCDIHIFNSKFIYLVQSIMSQPVTEWESKPVLLARRQSSIAISNIPATPLHAAASLSDSPLRLQLSMTDIAAAPLSSPIPNSSPPPIVGGSSSGTTSSNLRRAPSIAMHGHIPAAQARLYAGVQLRAPVALRLTINTSMKPDNGVSSDGVGCSGDAPAEVSYAAVEKLVTAMDSDNDGRVTLQDLMVSLLTYTPTVNNVQYVAGLVIFYFMFCQIYIIS